MDKIYCGKAKEVTGQYGTFYKLNLCIDDIPAEYMTVGKNGKRYVNLEMNMMRARDERDNTHTITVSTWRPDPPAMPSQQSTRPGQEFPGPEDFQDDGLPF